MDISRLTKSKIYTRIKSSDIYETLKHSQNYFLGQIITTGLAFLSIPIFTRLFTREDYGIVNVYNAYLAIIIIVLSANAHSSVSRYYFEKKEDFNEFLGTTLFLTGIIFLFVTSAYLLLYNHIESVMNLPGLLPLLLILSSCVVLLNTIYLQIIQAQKRSLESATINVLKGVLTLGLAIILVLSLEKDRYLGKIYATLIIGFIFSLYIFYRILKGTKLAFKKYHVKYILFYSIPLIPYALGSIILATFDRIMINDLVDASSAGIYSLGYNIALLVSMVISATQAALLPDFFDFLNKKQYSRLDALVGKVFSIITFSAFGLILFAKEIVQILADVKFHEALTIVPIVIIGYVFFGMFTVYGRYISYTKKTIYSSLIMVVSGLVNIILNALLIPQYGYVVAAYTTVVSYFVLFLLSWIIPKYVLKQKLTPLWKIWKPTLLLFVYLVFYFIITPIFTHIVLLLAVKMILVLLFGITVFYRELKVLIISSRTTNNN